MYDEMSPVVPQMRWFVGADEMLLRHHPEAIKQRRLAKAATERAGRRTNTSAHAKRNGVVMYLWAGVKGAGPFKPLPRLRRITPRSSIKKRMPARCKDRRSLMRVSVWAKFTHIVASRTPMPM